jgi:hypothetical protein
VVDIGRESFNGLHAKASIRSFFFSLRIVNIRFCLVVSLTASSTSM